jgi:hypothetical protein
VIAPFHPILNKYIPLRKGGLNPIGRGKGEIIVKDQVPIAAT